VMNVLVRDIKRYESFLHDTLFKLPGITHVRSAIVLKQIKSEVPLPLNAPLPAPAAGGVGRRRRAQRAGAR
jgi:Lrp/AsnC family transcriptional regulator, leucine-responsive regulatory protein